MRFRNFLKKSFENFRKFSQEFQHIAVFVKKRKRLTQGLLNLFENYAKIMHFRNFLRKSFENFLEISYAKTMHFPNFLKKFVWKFSKSVPPPEKFLATPIVRALCNNLQRAFLIYSVLKERFMLITIPHLSISSNLFINIY